MSPRKNRDKRGGYVLMGDDASTSGKAATTLVWQDSEPAFAGGAPVARTRASEPNLPEFRPARQTPRSERRAGMTPVATPEESVPVTRHPDRRPPRRQVPEMEFPDFEALISGGKPAKSARRRSATGTPEDSHTRPSGYSGYGGNPGEPEFPDLSARRTESTAHADRYPPSRTAGSGESAHRAVGTDSARQRSAGYDPLAAERAVRHAQSFTAGDAARQEKQPLSFAFPTDEKARARRQDFEFPEMPGSADRSRNRPSGHEPEERPARRRPGSHAVPESQSASRRPVDTGYPGDEDLLDARTAAQWGTEPTGYGAPTDPRGSDARKVSAGTGFLDVGMPGRTGQTEKTPESLPPEEEPVFDFSTFDLSTLLPEDDTLEAATPETPPEPVTAPQRDVPEGWTPAPEIKLPEEIPPVSTTERSAEKPPESPTEHRAATAPSPKPAKEDAQTGASPEVPPKETGAQQPPVYPEYPPESQAAEKDSSRGWGILGAGLGFAAGRASARATQPQTPTAASSTKPLTSATKTGAATTAASQSGASATTGQTPRPPDKATPEKKTGDRKTTEKKSPETKPQNRKTPEYGRSQGQPVIGGVPIATGKTGTAGTAASKTTATGTTGGKTTATGTAGKTTTTGAAGNGGGSGTPSSRRRRRPVMATTGQKLMILILGVALAFVLGILGGVVLSYGSWFNDDPEPGHTEDSGPSGDTADPAGTDEGTTDTTGNGEQTDPTDFTDSTDTTDTTDSTDTTDTTDSTDTTDTTETTDSTEETDPHGSVPGGDQPGNNDPQPTDPKPTDPQPTDPKPTDPRPTEPRPTEPRPTEPQPTEPKPTEPKPTEPQPTEPEPTDPPEPPDEIDPEDYFFHDADKRYLTEADYKHLTDWELVLARNEIFARHGRRFDTPEIQAYFDSCPWYKGTIDPEDFDISVLNKYERENIRILKAEGDSRKKQEEDKNKEQLIADSDKRFLTKADYAHLDDWELILARNEIFARHGRRFAIPEIQDYFDSLSWYEGAIDPEDFDTSVLNQYERENVRILKEEGQSRDEQSGGGGNSEYFFADSDSRYLSKADYIDLSLWELILARNEIFARHGRRFDTPEIQEYFDGLSWYKGTVDPEDFDSSVFNDYELRNIQLLKAASDAR